MVALRTELDAIEREAQQLVLECVSHTSLAGLPKEVRAIRAEFDAIEREAHRLAAECRARSIVDPLLPKEVRAIRAEFDAIKHQAQQLAAWVRSKAISYSFVSLHVEPHKACRRALFFRGRPRSRK